jgi:hypothetical protein
MGRAVNRMRAVHPGEVLREDIARKVLARESTRSLKGMFGKPKRAVSIEAMNAAIARRGASTR